MSKRQGDNPYKFSLLITCVPITWKYSLTIGLFSVPTSRLLNALIVLKCPLRVSELNGKMSPLRSKECGRINKVVVGRGSLYCDTFRTPEVHWRCFVYFSCYTSEKREGELVRDGSLWATWKGMFVGSLGGIVWNEPKMHPDNYVRSRFWYRFTTRFCKTTSKLCSNRMYECLAICFQKQSESERNIPGIEVTRGVSCSHRSNAKKTNYTLTLKYRAHQCVDSKFTPVFPMNYRRYFLTVRHAFCHVCGQ